MEYYVKENQLLIQFHGELGSLEVWETREKVVALIEQKRPATVILDLEDVKYLDSSSIGFILARYKQLSQMGSKLMICGIHPHVSKILEISGIYQLVTCVNSKEKEEVR